VEGKLLDASVPGATGPDATSRRTGAGAGAVRQVRLGLVGAGLHGARYARHITRDVDTARLVALCRRDRAAGEAQARDHSAEYVPSIEALVRRADLDAIVVVTPPANHLSACRLALAAGKDVLVEKPIVSSLAEGEELASIVRTSGHRLMLAQTLRYDGVLREVKRRLPGLGRIVRVQMAQRLEPSPLAWQREHALAGAGSILLTGVHLFDSVRWLFDDEVAEVFCRARQVLNPSHEDFFTASVVLRRSGIFADLEISKYSQSRSCRIEVVGETGQLVGDYWHHRLSETVGRQERQLPLPPETYTVEATVRAFCRAWLDGAPMPITVDDGLRTLEIAEACYASVATRRPIRTPRSS
jgi:predicted dehydrogenase